MQVHSGSLPLGWWPGRPVPLQQVYCRVRVRIRDRVRVRVRLSGWWPGRAVLLQQVYYGRVVVVPWLDT